MDAVSEARLQNLHPRLAEKIRLLDEQYSTEFPDEHLRVTFGQRSWGEQAALWAQGRESLDEVNRLRAAVNLPPLASEAANVQVTNAQPGHSWHQFAMAVDVVPMAPAPDWKSAHWPRIVAIGESLGLTSGIGWGDQPHFQLTGRFGLSPDDEVRQLFTDGGVQAVWAEAQIP